MATSDLVPGSPRIAPGEGAGGGGGRARHFPDLDDKLMGEGSSSQVLE